MLLIEYKYNMYNVNEHVMILFSEVVNIRQKENVSYLELMQVMYNVYALLKFYLLIFAKKMN